ncbi:YetF domain-containing protein [Thermosediminibacter oceani]|uniref:YetF C-terminal domain-containing protein n=1 Tax=Thermosediminibacter oceani (strain ATCC BAA-1034 / DSM 16646 / JW/IW-1228P) TaxID=555079 RepID=D9S2C0_THEOJ|nr:DUF421 domain-containing protein [Thermosediminibacter oceani]ADL07547.1 protein of unknown function DUF421 [Thermosediminibacter oceani DSM 16646]
MNALLKEFMLLAYRSVILFTTSLVLVRIMGKRTIAQLSPFDLILIIIMGSAIAIPLEDFQIPLSFGIIPVIVISVLNYLLAILIMKNRKLENLLQGTSTVLVKDGEVIVQNLKKERITIADLLILLREKNVTDINEVQEATIEPNGKLSILKKKDREPVTPKDLGLEPSQGIFPTVVVHQGQVEQNNLDTLGVGIDRLLVELKKKGINRLSEIKAAWVDEEGKLEIDRFDQGQSRRAKKHDGFYSKLGVSTDEVKREFGIDPYLFLDAVSLGLKDEEISELLGYELEKVKALRERLGNVGSEIGLYYKKDLPV